MTLGERLTLVRNAQKMNQTEFAKSVGATRSAYSMYEINRVPLSESMLKLICVTYKINPRWLETGEGDMHAKTSANLAHDVREIMRGESEFAVAVMASLAAMPPEWWDAWKAAFEAERKK